MVARRRRRRVRGARARVPLSTSRRGDPAGAARMATWLACDRAGLPRRVRGGERLARLRAAPARRARAGTGPRLAGLLRGLHGARGAATMANGRSSSLRQAAEHRPAARGGRTWRCSAWHSRARRWWRARRSTRACAASTRRPRPPWRARPTVPISGAWACCFLVTACVGGARLRARVRRGATGSPSSPSATGAATCSRSAARSTARCTSGAGRLGATAEDGARGVGRGLLALATQRWSAARWWRWPSCDGARVVPEEALALLLDQAGASPIVHSCASARLALDRGADTVARSSLPSGCCASCPTHRQAGPGAGARAAGPRADSLAASSTRRAPALESLCGRSSGWSGPRRCARRRGSRPTEASRPARGDHDRGADAAGGRRRRLRAEPADRYEAARARIELATSLVRARSRPTRRAARRPRRWTTLRRARRRGPRPSGRGACSSAIGSMRRRSALRIRAHAARARGAVACSPTG